MHTTSPLLRRHPSMVRNGVGQMGPERHQEPRLCVAMNAKLSEETRNLQPYVSTQILKYWWWWLTYNVNILKNFAR